MPGRRPGAALTRKRKVSNRVWAVCDPMRRTSSHPTPAFLSTTICSRDRSPTRRRPSGGSRTGPTWSLSPTAIEWSCSVPPPPGCRVPAAGNARACGRRGPTPASQFRASANSISTPTRPGSSSTRCRACPSRKPATRRSRVRAFLRWPGRWASCSPPSARARAPRRRVKPGSRCTAHRGRSAAGHYSFHALKRSPKRIDGAMSCLARRGQAALVGEDHRVDAVTCAELGEDPPDVGLDRGLLDDELGCDLAV